MAFSFIYTIYIYMGNSTQTVTSWPQQNAMVFVWYKWKRKFHNEFYNQKERMLNFYANIFHIKYTMALLLQVWQFCVELSIYIYVYTVYVNQIREVFTKLTRLQASRKEASIWVVASISTQSPITSWMETNNTVHQHNHMWDHDTSITVLFLKHISNAILSA